MSRRIGLGHIALMAAAAYLFAPACSEDDAVFGQPSGAGGTDNATSANNSANVGGSNNTVTGTGASGVGGNNVGGSSTAGTTGSGGSGMCGTITCQSNESCCNDIYCYPSSCTVCCQGGQGGGSIVSSSAVGTTISVSASGAGGGGVTCGNQTCLPGWNCCTAMQFMYCSPTMCPP